MSGMGGEAGKASSIRPSAHSTACSSPDRVEKRSTSLSRPSGHVKSAWAAASVAWPQRSTSTEGVNQRNSKDSPLAGAPSIPSSCAPLSGRTKAVSGRFWLRATRSIHSVSAASSSSTTAAGLPANGRRVKASMCSSGGNLASTTLAGVKSRREAIAAARPRTRISGLDAVNGLWEGVWVELL